MAGEGNNNQQNNQNNNGEGNNNQQNTNQQNNQQQQNNQSNNNNQQSQQIDVGKVKSEAMSDLFKALGVESEDALKTIVTKHNEQENANKTDLQKAQDTLTATTKELATERAARMLAEAKLSAIKLGAKPELVDDLVTVAMARVTKDKDVNAVMAEIKDGATGSIYFASKDEQQEGNKNKNITNKRTSNSNNQNQNQNQQNANNNNNNQLQNNNNSNQNNQQNSQHSGSIAERLMAKRKVAKPHYFK